MSSKSMTGFARADGAHGAAAWVWEVRSVNARGLDIRVRIPPGLEGLEAGVRTAAAKKLARGSLGIALALKRSALATQVRVNEAALGQVIAALESIRARLGAPAPRAENLLAIKGVVEVVEAEETAAEAEALSAALLASFESALAELVRVRAAEGDRLAAAIGERLDAIDRLIAVISAAPVRSPAAVRQRLKEQVARLLEAGVGLDESRLGQEAALLATRADISEELQRLAAHVAAARELLATSRPAGRQLDFLAQELNREANTLCAKAADTDTARAGLELKVLIDQMREQVQNIE
jgi:uncharacterized protein (TIGR00255 family)